MSEELQNVATEEVVAEAPAQAQAPVDKKKYFKHKLTNLINVSKIVTIHDFEFKKNIDLNIAVFVISRIAVLRVFRRNIGEWMIGRKR